MKQELPEGLYLRSKRDVVESVIDKLKSFIAVFFCFKSIVLGTCSVQLTDLGGNKNKNLVTSINL